MKQNIFNRLLSACGHPAAMAALLAGALSVSCKEESTGLLPAGTSPVIPSTQIQAIPAENGTEAWIGDEQVAVRAVSSQNGVETIETGIYDAEADGIMTSAEPIWWNNSGETKKITAWYCGDGSTGEEGKNIAAVPAVWTVQADQTGDGYNASKLLYAPAVTASYAPSRIVPMTFYHQTAKINMDVIEEGDISSASQIKSVTIKNIKLSGKYSAPTAEGATRGTWTTDGNDQTGDLKLSEYYSQNSTALVSYIAYAIPQSIKEATVEVVTESNTLTATVPDYDEDLAAGKVNNYKITVTDNTLKVDAVYIATAYEPEDLKLGDYFYSDGTVSDGGLRGIYSDGTLKMEETKPGPVSGKTVVGIVFIPEQDRIGQAEKDALGGSCDGLVLSLKNASTAAVTWGVKGTAETGVTLTDKLSEQYADVSGYNNYVSLCNAHTEDLDSYPAFKAVKDFNETVCPITGTNTTGWFLPSVGQWFDMLEILGDCTLLENKSGQMLEPENSTSNGYSFNFTVSGVHDKLNAWMSTVIDSSKDEFVTSNSANNFWTSGQRSNTNAYRWALNSTTFYLQGEDKANAGKASLVRPFLAFKLGEATAPTGPVEPTE